MFRKGLSFIAGVTLVLVVLPAITEAQQASGIAGVVRDTSGGILPGVTVEVRSPALIEGVRTVFTDGQGRYNVVDLRPGTYSVTFVLPGFATFVRDGITLTAGFTASVNAEMKVGGLEETITVTGASPLVDTSNVRRQTQVSRELLETLPTSTKNVNTFVLLTPGLSMDAPGRALDVAGQYSTQVGGTYHGRGGTKTQFDGMGIQNLSGDGNAGYQVNALLVEELVLLTSGVSAESNADGALMNMVPKEGANTFSGTLSGLWFGDNMQNSNFSSRLADRGLTHVNRTLKIYDAGVTVGGPIKRGKVWFFGALREWGNAHENAGIFWNATQGTPFYTPDLNRPADRHQWYSSRALRVTWQALPRHKFSFHGDRGNVCVCRTATLGDAPEAILAYRFIPNGFYSLSWTSPVTTRLLFEGAAGIVFNDWPQIQSPGVQLDHIAVVDLGTGMQYGNRFTYDDPNVQRRYTQRFSVSYVTGSHNFKTGVHVEQGVRDAHRVSSANNVSYTFRNREPVSLTQRATPYNQKEVLKADLGFFVQDQWAIDRLTLNLGLRYDYFNSYVPEHHFPATPNGWVPERRFDAVLDVPKWHDLNPRLGMAYDLFGTGRTAVKASLGRYVSKTGVNIAGDNNPVATAVNQVNRSWNDANRNYVPDCNLGNFAANGECGQISDLNFGGTRPSTVWSDEVLRGWGVRLAHWDFVTSVEHQFTQATGITVGYNRSWYRNFGVTKNVDVTAADYDPFTITAPLDPRLPGSGGYVISGLYDISPAKFGRVTNRVLPASDFGKQRRINDFFNVTLNTRFTTGMRLGGGVSTGRTVNDTCFVVNSPQELLNCRVVTPFKAQTEIKLHGSYPLPGDVVVSGVFLNLSGPSIDANYAATNAEVVPSLGRGLAGGARAVTVPLVRPKTLFESRIMRLDLRLTKLLRLTSRVRLQGNFDIYNVMNTDAILGSRGVYGSLWQTPTAILEGRIFQVSAQLNF